MRFARVPEPDWDEQCAATGSLFHRTGWQQVLATGLGCTTVYVSRPAGIKAETVLNVFPAGPFRVAYVAYPVGGTVLGTAVEECTLTALRHRRASVPIDLLRLPASAFGPQTQLLLRVAATPETAIPDLAIWHEKNLSSSVRRNLNRAARSGLRIAPITSVDAASALYGLYSATVRRHEGQLRYTPEYFSALLSFSAQESRIRILAATHGDRIAAFLIVALHESTAYYLHGALDMEFNSSRPSDALFREAIEWAKASGAAYFNMMSSPASQPSLVSFKEKWGGITRTHHTYEMPIRPFRAALFRVAERVMRTFKLV